MRPIVDLFHLDDGAKLVVWLDGLLLNVLDDAVSAIKKNEVVVLGIR